MIKPYYQDKWVTIYHGDCREVLPQLDVRDYFPHLKENKVDLVLTDPPYFAESGGIGRDHREYIGEGNTLDMNAIDYDDFVASWFSMVREKANGMVISTGTRSLWRYPPARWVVCWHKPGAVNHNPFGGFNIWEPILVYGELGRGRHFVEDYFSSTPFNLGHTLESQHPCPKNKNLWAWLIASSTNPDAHILDPFLGSGTTCYCAKKLNRYSIGIEIEEKYCEIAAKRCSQSVMELNL